MQQLSESEKKARGVLGVSRLKAHVGRLDLDSKVLFCFGSVAIDTSSINLSKTIKIKSSVRGDDWWAE